MRKRLIPAVVLVLVLAGCGGKQSAQSPTSQTSTRGSTTGTTTEPAVEPLSVDEKQWVTKVRRIRPRVDAVFGPGLSISLATTRSMIRVLRSCALSLEKAGVASERFASVEQAVRRACAKYEAAAKSFEKMLSASLPGTASVLAGSADERIYERSLDRGFNAQSKGSILMFKAEDEATEIQDEITAASGG